MEHERLSEAVEDFRRWLARDIGAAGGIDAVSDDPPTTCLSVARSRIKALEDQIERSNQKPRITAPCETKVECSGEVAELQLCDCGHWACEFCRTSIHVDRKPSLTLCDKCDIPSESEEFVPPRPTAIKIVGTFVQSSGGEYVDVRIFAGIEGNLQLGGQFMLRVGEWQLFACALMMGAERMMGHLRMEVDDPLRRLQGAAR